jgi:hypothetical protein
VHGFFLKGERSYFPSERETVGKVLLKHVDIDSSDFSDIPCVFWLQCQLQITVMGRSASSSGLK